MNSPVDHPLASFVKNLEAYCAIDPADGAALLELPYRARMLDSSVYLVREGDHPVNCGILLSGFAYRQKQTSDGQRQILSLHIPGECLDLQHLYLNIADHSVQMLSRGEVALVAMKDIQALLVERPGVARAILMNTLVEASIFREWILNVGRRDARTRLAHLLCEFAVRMHAGGFVKDGGYRLPVTQEQLADALGLTAVHVSRTLKSLETEGLIERNKRMVTFSSWTKLREIGDFNLRYLHLRDGDGVHENMLSSSDGANLGYGATA